MKNIRLIWVGKTQEPYLRSGIKEYMHKLSHYIKIDSDVIIKGPVIIGDNCRIEHGAIIGPNASIGDDSQISKCQIINASDETSSWTNRVDKPKETVKLV